MSLHWYCIESRDPLVFRQGRPFGSGLVDGGNFPWPSSAAGLLRTRHLDRCRMAIPLDDADQASLLAIQSVGPIIARRNGDQLTPLLPAPADAVLLRDDEGGGSLSWHQLRPFRLPTGCGCDLPAGLSPLGFAAPARGKAQRGPAFWTLDEHLRWALDGANANIPSHDNLPWLPDVRTHISIDRQRHAAASGQLFQTAGLNLDRRRLDAADGRPFGNDDHVFLVAGGGDPLAEATVCFGGERRLALMSPIDVDPLPRPQELTAALKPRLALTLLTPGLFADGWKPGWLNDALRGTPPGRNDLVLRLVAASIPGWQAISGWDLRGWHPRASRRAVAAGSVYFFDVESSRDAELDAMWMASISDDAQARRDGFGLVLSRPWTDAEQGDDA